MKELNVAFVLSRTSGIRIRNEIVWNVLSLEPLEEKAQKYKTNWEDRLNGMYENRVPEMLRDAYVFNDLDRKRYDDSDLTFTKAFKIILNY